MSRAKEEKRRLPITVETLENKNTGYDAVVVGVGEDGEKAVRQYLLHGESFGYFHTVTFFGGIENGEESEELNGALKNASWLFVMANTRNEADKKSALVVAESHKETAESPFSALVLLGSESSSDSREAFDTILSAENADAAYQPIDMLISRMCSGDIGFDYADLVHLVKNTQCMRFAQERAENVGVVNELAAALEGRIKETADGDQPQNAIFYISVPQDCLLETVVQTLERVYAAMNNGSVVWQVKFSEDENDKSFTAMMLYGAQKQ